MWHMVVRPEVDGEMGRFGQWLGLTHTQRHHAHDHTAGDGHLYQGRFKSFLRRLWSPTRPTLRIYHQQFARSSLQMRRIYNSTM